MPLWTIAIPRRDPKLYVSAAAELLVYVKRQGAATCASIHSRGPDKICGTAPGPIGLHAAWNAKREEQRRGNRRFASAKMNSSPMSVEFEQVTGDCSTSETQGPEHRLPRRDWLLLPLIVLSVTIVFLGASDLVADRMFPETGQLSCAIIDRFGLPRQKPNCVCRYKNPEGPLVEYRYNECGYRSAKPCGMKPRDTVRVVVMGASVAWGLYIPAAETFGARTEAALNRICSRPVEVQNMGGMVLFKDLPKLAREALGLTPDVIVLTVGPFDLEELAGTERPSNPHAQSIVGRTKLAWHNLMARARQSKFVFAAYHYMLLDTQVLYEAYMHMGGSREVMRSPQTAEGDQMYADFANALDRMMAKLAGSGVSVVVMAVPNRVAAAMVSNRSHLDGTDPLLFGRRISEIAVQHGAIALDVTPGFANFAHAEQLYYPVDNHPNGDGHAVIGQALVDRLTDGSIPQLAACRVTSQIAKH